MWGCTVNDQSYSKSLNGRPRVQSVIVRRPMRRWTLVMITAVVTLVPAACAYKGLSMPAVSAVVLQGQGTLAAPAPGAVADTYNTALAPAGARLEATMTPLGESTIAALRVSGMLPDRGYAAHAHTTACNVNPASAGPHYQNRIDPAATAEAPSTNPEFANPQNEIWLDFHTNASGSGSSRTTVPFVFTTRGPGSIVVHEAQQTATGPGQAGQAGARIACLTLSAVGRQGFHPFG
jgi:Cu-Zn family superoxide dismutase